jgi:acid phosphatase family membrane protein YuiD
MLMSIAALLLAPSAADVACITGKVSTADRQAAFEEATGGKPGAMRQKVAGLAAACGKERGWSAEQLKEREHTALLDMVFDPALDHLERRRIPAATVRTWFAAQKAEVRADPGSHAEVMDSLVEALSAAGVKKADIDASAESIGLFLGLLSIAEQLGYVPRR